MKNKPATYSRLTEIDKNIKNIKTDNCRHQFFVLRKEDRHGQKERTVTVRIMCALCELQKDLIEKHE